MEDKIDIIDTERYKYGFNYGLVCNFIKKMNTQFEIYKENIHISTDTSFIEGFKIGVKEKMNLEYIEECFLIKHSIEAIFINFENESQKIRNIYSIFLLAVLSGFTLAISAKIFYGIS